MGFYIEELPTEFNGITMEDADYLADEFLKDTPCNRMWDAMRALRDFYETVTSEAVEVADRKTDSEKPNNSTGYNLSPVDKDINVRSKDEPQTCSVNGRPYTDCSRCEYFRCTADEPQTEDLQDWKDRMWAEAVIEPQTDCAWR